VTPVIMLHHAMSNENIEVVVNKLE
jgi:hypothetical protein